MSDSGNEAIRAMYGGTESVRSAYVPSLRAAADRLRDATGMSAEEADDHLTEVSHFFHDAGIPSSEAAGFHSMLVHHTTSPVDDATLRQWTVESRRQIREAYGDRADARMEQVEAFLDAHPSLKAQLTETGLASNPRVVMALVERADQLRGRPRTTQAPDMDGDEGNALERMYRKSGMNP